MAASARKELHSGAGAAQAVQRSKLPRAGIPFASSSSEQAFEGPEKPIGLRAVINGHWHMPNLLVAPYLKLTHQPADQAG